MPVIKGNDVLGALGNIGIKVCSGLKGMKCFRPRRARGRLCVECHRNYMREYMRKKTSSNRVTEVDGYNFNQEPDYNG